MIDRETMARPNKIAISVFADVVTVEFILGDDYAATVFHDDLISRLKAGEGVMISVQSPKETDDE